MRPIVTDRVVWSVSLSVTIVSPAKTTEPIEMLFAVWTWVGRRPCIRWRSRYSMGKSNYVGGYGRHILKYRDFLPRVVQKTAEPMEMMFEMWSWMVPGNHVFDAGGLWRHLANSIEPYVRDSDAALCQITLTTCLDVRYGVCGINSWIHSVSLVPVTHFWFTLSGTRQIIFCKVTTRTLKQMNVSVLVVCLFLQTRLFADGVESAVKLWCTFCVRSVVLFDHCLELHSISAFWYS